VPKIISQVEVIRRPFRFRSPFLNGGSIGVPENGERRRQLVRSFLGKAVNLIRVFVGLLIIKKVYPFQKAFQLHYFLWRRTSHENGTIRALVMVDFTVFPILVGN